MSAMRKNKAPATNPMAAGTHEKLPIGALSAKAGAKSDQKLAASITPAANPSIKWAPNLDTLLLVKKTVAAPKAVINQVKLVAIKACNTGLLGRMLSIYVIVLKKLKGFASGLKLESENSIFAKK